jgi:tRNA pseudouridine38-40 synthase
MISTEHIGRMNMSIIRNQKLLFWFVFGLQVLLDGVQHVHAMNVANGGSSFPKTTTTTTTTTTSTSTTIINNSNESTVRYRCRVAYEGGGFSGFQIQHASARTVQGELEAVLSRRFDRPVRVVGAGRTDAGVHARGQAIHFDLSMEESQKLELELELELDQLERAMNKLLTQDVRVWNLKRAPPPSIEFVNGKRSIHSWNVMRKCHSKLYVYRFSTSPAMDPSIRHHRWQLDLGGGPDLDTEFLSTILEGYQGTRDFICFAGAIEQTQKKTGRIMNTVRTVYNVTLVDEDDGNYRVEILLKGALYKMVRNMVGTAIAVCRGRVSEQDFQTFLNPQEAMTRDDNRCKPAPPQGLTLERVFYHDEDDF